MTYKEARRVAVVRDSILSGIIGLLAALALRTDLHGIAEYMLTWIICAGFSAVVLIGLDPFIRHNAKTDERPVRRQLKIYNIKKGEREC